MMLRPDAVVTSVTEVTPDFLRAHGARAVMVDLDDTLLAAGSDLLEPDFRDWLVSLRAARIPVVILSNGAHTRVTRWAQELELVGLSLTGKPWGRAFRRGLAELGTPASETAMVGDQLFTDVFGANRAGLTSVLVALAREGRGLAWAPMSLVADDLARGSLARAAGPEADIPVEIRLYRPRARQSPAAERLWALAGSAG